MKNKILIIEDNKDLQEIYMLNFEAHNFLVEIADDWMDGLVKILDFIPDIILLDIMMPSMDGFEVLKTIQDQSSIKTPIIVCSNLNSEEDVKKSIQLWADMYLRKSDYEWEQIVKKALELLPTLKL